MIKLFWIWFHRKYSCPTSTVSVPIGILGKTSKRGRFLYHYVLHDENGDTKLGAKTMREAVRIHKETGLYITRIQEEYL